MKTLLVIGGTGFFGKSILDAYSRNLLAPWHISKVIVMSRNATKLLHDTPDLVGPNIELYSADITNTEGLPLADYVIHAAASTDVRNYLSSPEDEKKNIQAGTYHYCDLARIHHANSKIVYVSSGAVYGLLNFIVPNDRLINGIHCVFNRRRNAGIDPIIHRLINLSGCRQGGKK